MSGVSQIQMTTLCHRFALSSLESLSGLGRLFTCEVPEVSFGWLSVIKRTCDCPKLCCVTTKLNYIGVVLLYHRKHIFAFENRWKGVARSNLPRVTISQRRTPKDHLELWNECFCYTPWTNPWTRCFTFCIHLYTESAFSYSTCRTSWEEWTNFDKYRRLIGRTRRFFTEVVWNNFLEMSF